MTRLEVLTADLERALWDFLGDEAGFAPEYPKLAEAFARVVATVSHYTEHQTLQRDTATKMLGELNDLVQALFIISEL